MSKPRVYTVRTSVSMRREHRVEFEAALPEDVGLSTFLRDAALRYIGHGHLVVPATRAETRRFWRGEDEPEAPWVFLPISMTKEQNAVLTKEAKKRSLTLSVLVQDALRLELGLPPAAETAKGWKRGERRSGPPPKNTARAISIPNGAKVLEINGHEMRVQKATADLIVLRGERRGTHKMARDPDSGQWVFRRYQRDPEAITSFRVLK